MSTRKQKPSEILDYRSDVIVITCPKWPENGVIAEATFRRAGYALDAQKGDAPKDQKNCVMTVTQEMLADPNSKTQVKDENGTPVLENGQEVWIPLKAIFLGLRGYGDDLDA